MNDALDSVAAARAEYTARRAGRGRPAARPGRDVPPLVRRRARRRAARAQRDGGRHRVSRLRARRARLVLLKGVSDDGFVFYTNTGSRKGHDLAGNPRCSLLFPWHPLERQVRVDGTATLLPREAVDDYFAVRPRGSQLGAWASHQSQRGRRPRRAAARRTTRRSGATPAATCRRPRSGAATSCTRSRWSSGRAGPAGCTTGWSTGAASTVGRTAGGPSGWRPEVSPHMAHTDHGPRGEARHNLDVRDQAPVPREPAPAPRRASMGRRRRRPQVARGRRRRPAAQPEPAAGRRDRGRGLHPRLPAQPGPPATSRRPSGCPGRSRRAWRRWPTSA